MPNFMKIERGPFFFVDLVWNDPYMEQLIVRYFSSFSVNPHSLMFY